MEIFCEASVRADLLGGTLDLWPINLCFKKVTILNLALDLKAKVKIQSLPESKIIISSRDFDCEREYPFDDFNPDNLYGSNHFGEFEFVAHLITLFGPSKSSGFKLELSSGSPAGAGLGGSSSMGITLYKALCEWHKIEFNRDEAIRIVSSIEAKILNAGAAGFQDYYPAVYGGVLALESTFQGVKVNQLYSTQLADFLQKNCILVYSGVQRNSGINNWEVYKRYFDRDKKIQEGLQNIADLSLKAFHRLSDNDFDTFLALVTEEGRIRTTLFEGILPQEIEREFNQWKKEAPSIGLKMCGAGGGGCFLLTHSPCDREVLIDKVEKSNMTVLDFKIAPPLKGHR